MPMCIAMLQNQAKNMTCQNVNFTCPGSGSPPVQMSVCACDQNPSSEVDADLAQPDEPERDEHQHHPRRGDVRDARHDLVAVGRDDGDERAHRQRPPRPSRRCSGRGRDSCGIEMSNQTPDRRRVDRDHRAGEEAEHHAVGEVVDRHQLAPADLLELVVERQARARGDGRGQQRPAEHGEQVADEQSADEVDGAHARGHEQRADHQLGAGRVLAGVLADEAPEPEVRPLGHRLAFELLDGFLGRDVGCVGHTAVRGGTTARHHESNGAGAPPIRFESRNATR